MLRHSVGLRTRQTACVKRYSTSAECLRRIADIDQGHGGVNAFVALANESAAPTQQDALPLLGIPIAVKDNICTSDMPSTCSSRMLAKFKPTYDATVVQLLRAAGAHIIGKTNCDEFGMGSMNTFSAHGHVVNPYQDTAHSNTTWRTREQRVAGGSSGGSAAAVAAKMCDIALSTDTGGSTRLPASYCGVFGLKPSYGLISRWGVVSYADSLDCVGIMTRSIADVAATLREISAFDPKDPTSIPKAPRDQAEADSRYTISKLGTQGELDLSGLRIGVPKEYFPTEIDQRIIFAFHSSLALLRKRGASIIPISLPTTQYALSAYYVIASAEANSNLARYDGMRYGHRVQLSAPPKSKSVLELYSLSRSEAFGDEVKKRILLGAYTLTADAFDNYFLQAQRVRNLIKADFDRIFRQTNPLSPSGYSSSIVDHNNFDAVDIIMHPSAIGPAPPLGPDVPSLLSTLDGYVQDVLTVPASLAGIPSLNVPMQLPATQEGNWPIGVSLTGQWGSESLLLHVGSILEDSLNTVL